MLVTSASRACVRTGGYLAFRQRFLMHLKSLALQGFKSFADRTVFEFHEGVTGIVGPNGCGKSNVVDAIRWVLGETSAKALRGGEMSDVIFNGTDKRKPTGMAEVTMTLSDCETALKVDYNEVSISRRVYREGKSEYLINGTLCRLRDIHELFMDTGIGRSAYSIMEQGKIDLLLSARPEDRRQVFEEAAGITKFKKEKKEALRKLDYTEANLLRVSDVLAEQERRINSLKRQVSKARRYQALATDVNVLDTHFSHRRHIELTAELEELKTLLNALSISREELSEDLPEREAAVVSSRDKAQNLEAELSELRQQLSGHLNAVQAAGSRIEFNRERREELEARIVSHREEIVLTEQKLSQQELDFTESRTSLDDLLARIAEQEVSLTRKEEEVSGLTEQRREVEQARRTAQQELKKVDSGAAAAEAKLESSRAQAVTSENRLRHLVEEQEVLRVETAELQGMAGQISERLTTAEGRSEQLDQVVQVAERSFQHSRGDLDALRQRRDGLEREVVGRQSRLDILTQLLERGEGLNEGTKNVLSGLNDPELIKPGIQGVLGNQLRVRAGFERAVEAALGGNLEAILVRDADLAEAILGRLEEKAQGRVTLIAPEWIRPTGGRQLMTVPDGAECWAVDCSEVEEGVAEVVERLLDQVLVVATRAVAAEIKGQYPDLIFVTLAGELIRPEGMATGGQAGGEGSSSLLERQNEVAELTEEVALLITDRDAVVQEHTEREELVESLRADLETARQQMQKHALEISTLQGERSLAEREVKSFQSKLETVTWEHQEITSRQMTESESFQGLETQLLEFRDRSGVLTVELDRVEAELIELTRREQGDLEERGSLQTALAVERRALQSAQQQQQPMESRLTELRELNARRRAEADDFERRISDAVAEDELLLVNIEENTAAATTLEEQLTEASARRSDLLRAISEAEATLSDVRQKVDSVIEQRGREEVSVAKIEMRLEKLTDDIMERYQVELSAFEPDSHLLLTCIAEQKKAHGSREKRRANMESKNDEEGEDTPSEEAEEAAPEEEGTLAQVVEHELDVLSEEEGPDWDWVETALAGLRKRLDSMGPVNLDAIEEFEELEERHLFVKGQHDDLVNSKDELINVIDRINVETTKLFAETFGKVQVNFRSMFKELFGEKGKADLILLDDEDPLECGIEVIAKPPGKKLQSISLLSGGERSMTAVALLFSIYMVKPSPFCVLDELDAPLDEANIGRFLKVLDRFIDQSQFIIVTHNKRTMARADVMYGVTMEEFGISKPVGMRLTDADSQKKTATTAAQKAAEKLDA
jgi:chromosome segregation protein